MISKFIKIKNIGRFRDFSASGDITFGKVNIIYGENSTGKTTLTSLIRSLISNKSDLVLERKTFSSTDEQYVELLFNGKVFKFQNSSWNNCDIDLNIEIFDEFFINENIYTGLDILSEHQKYLYQFAIGEEGIALAREIEKIKKDLQTNKHPDLNSLKQQIQRLIEKYFEVEEFVNLNEDKEIDKKIEEKNREISVAEASNEIREKELLKEIQPLSLPFDLGTIKHLLEKSLTTISEEALQKVTQHISKLGNVLKEDTETWLHQGLLCVENIKDNSCPFCQRDITTAESTIKSYQQYFNEDYRKLKGDIDKYSGQIQGFNIEQFLNKIEIIGLNNSTLIEYWKRFLTAIEFPQLKEFEEYSGQIAKFFKGVKLLFENKSKSILEPINADYIDRLSESVKKLNDNITAYNQKIRNYNKTVTELKAKQSDINELKNDFKKLEIQKERFSEKTKDLCNKYQKCEEEIKELDKLVEQKKKDLNSAIFDKVGKYGAETNRILEKFGAPFKIVRLTQRYRGKGEEPYLEYFLEIEGYEVNPLQEAKFTLSGGDKNAIALAFFFAKIIVDKRIENKIIIFDDPISSFDINRKRRTIEFIRDLSKNAKQTIVLTHLNTFAFELYDSLKDIGVSPKCLQIINRNLKEWNINEDKKPPFFKNFSRLETFISNNEKINLDEARRLIRICLEDKLNFGYFQFLKDLGDDFWLGTMVKRFRELKDNPSFKFKHSNNEEVINELENLCDFSGPSHHSNITTTYRTDYTHTEIVNYVKSSLKLIYEWL